MELVGKRVLLIGGVGVVKGRVRGAAQAMVDICDEWEPLLTACRFVDGAPFDTISVVLEFGRERSAEPTFGRLDAKNSELPVSCEIPMEELRWAKTEDVYRLFSEATLLVLVAVADRYGLRSPLGMRK